MMNRLQAQEQLMAISAAGLGSGAVKKHDARRALSRLEAVAEGGRRQAQKASPDMLRAMGIAVEIVPTAVKEQKNG